MSASPLGARPVPNAVGDGAARSVRHPLARALLALTFSTGLVDAVSYLGLGRVFTANMTGNIVLLGFGIASSEGLPVVAPLVSLGAFLAGSAIGGVLAVTTADRRPQHVARTLGMEIGLLLGAAIVAATADVQPAAFSGDVVIAMLALAMGVRNATVRRLAVPAVMFAVQWLATAMRRASRPPRRASATTPTVRLTRVPRSARSPRRPPPPRASRRRR